MKSISVLDCTLRDGGYVNNWKFGEKAIKTIIEKLDEANLDIIECGFLTDAAYDSDYTLFNSVKEIQEMVKNKNKNSMIVAMIAIGEKEIHPAKLSQYDGKSIDGIRLTFHKNEIEKAIEWANIIKDKGYKVFMQPVGTTSYNDIELLELVEKMNELDPYALYIVDTLGSMYRNRLLHMFYLIDENLKPQINIGFHPHNNLQLAFSNAQELNRIQTPRRLIVDSSIFGMGRAAGNLPTELITEYINRNIGHQYDVPVILSLYDDYISLIRQDFEWGYEIAYHIAASNVCHPNYASFLLAKQTLTIKDIEKIIIMIPKEKRAIFNKKIIEDLYIQFQNRKIDDTNTVNELKKVLKDRDILVLAPGKSLKLESKKIEAYIKAENPYVISVNFVDPTFELDACFVSNHKRIENVEMELKKMKDINVILTSNITKGENANYSYIDYCSYINQDEIVFDNAGLMLLKLLEKCNVNKVTLAGFDGFKAKYDENYYDGELNLQFNEHELNEKQKRIKNQLNELAADIQISFLTSSVYER